MKTLSKKCTIEKLAILPVVLFALFLSLSAVAQDEWKAPAGTEKVKNPLAGKPAADGKALYEKNCTQCHGATGKGDGPKGEEIEKTPTDFTSAKFSEQTDGAIFWKMTEGKKPMPSFKLELTDDQRWQLVNYIRSMKK